MRKTATRRHFSRTPRPRCKPLKRFAPPRGRRLRLRQFLYYRIGAHLTHEGGRRSTAPCGESLNSSYPSSNTSPTSYGPAAVEHRARSPPFGHISTSRLATGNGRLRYFLVVRRRRYNTPSRFSGSVAGAWANKPPWLRVERGQAKYAPLLRFRTAYSEASCIINAAELRCARRRRRVRAVPSARAESIRAVREKCLQIFLNAIVTNSPGRSSPGPAFTLSYKPTILARLLMLVSADSVNTERSASSVAPSTSRSLAFRRMVSGLAFVTKQMEYLRR